MTGAKHGTDGWRGADGHYWQLTFDAFDKAPVPARASVDPDVARAGEPGIWRVSVVLAEHALRAGSHLLLEVSSHWHLHLGRPVRIPPIVRDLAPAEQIEPGYGCRVRADLPAGVGHDLTVHYGSYWNVIDVAITSGEVLPGTEVCIWLGSREGSRFRTQNFAQKSVFFAHVDLRGDGDYRPLSESPTVEVIGSHAAMLKLVVPASAPPGQPFEASVMAVDLKNMNPASAYSAEVQVCDARTEEAVADPVAFRDERFSVKSALVHGREGEGVRYLTAVDQGHAMMCRSNPCHIGGSNIYFGDLHGQNYVGQGTGSMDEYYVWAREAERLDFCAWAGYEWRTPLDGDKWRQRVVDVANRHNDEGRFVVLQGFEFSGAGGHRNAYVPGDDIPLHGAPHQIMPADTVVAPGEKVPSGADPKYLWRALEGTEAITIPHHPIFFAGADWKYRNDDMQPVVEICSQWGISEEGGPHSVQAALRLGHRFGFVGGTDTHKGQPGHGGHHLNEGIGLTAVHAAGLTRRAIFDAIRARRCYATDGPRILLDYSVTVGDAVLKMGEEGRLNAASRHFRIQVAGCEALSSVEILRNGEVVHYVTPGELHGNYEWKDTADLDAHLIRETPFGDQPFVYYYVRVSQEDGRKAWGSPVWLGA